MDPRNVRINELVETAQWDLIVSEMRAKLWRGEVLTSPEIYALIQARKLVTHSFLNNRWGSK